MDIQWFPGHMAKARRQVEEILPLVDIVLELLDARLPLASHNPLLKEIIGRKPRLIMLNKIDLADKLATEQWITYFKRKNLSVSTIDAQSGTGIGQIPALCESILESLFIKRKAKGIISKRIRAMVLGIPNVGKSSLINRLAQRAATTTGNRPGVTKGQQWIRVDDSMELLDTPGILWPKFVDPQVGLRLAATRAIKGDVLPVEEVALYLIQLLRERYPELLQERYKVEVTKSDLDILEDIGKRRGCLQRGGVINLEKAADIILNDMGTGRIGRITLELPMDWMNMVEKNDY